MNTGVPFINFHETLADQRKEIDEAIARVIDRGAMILGPEVEAFQESFARYCGAKYAIGVGNGLEALSLAFRGRDIGAGDEIIVPSQTFVASWLAASHIGAVPVSVDVDPATYTLSPTRIEAALTPRTRAIMPVHLFGHAADMDPIRALAKPRGLFVLEDAAQAHGAGYKGRRCGVLGDAAGFSFYPTKNLGAFGDGGAIVTDDTQLAQKLTSLRNYGSNEKYKHDLIGFNSRLDEIQAAVLNVKLKYLDRANAARRSAAKRYTDGLRNLPGITVPSEASWGDHIYHLYVIQCDDRNGLAEHLKRREIQTLVHYPITPGRQKAYQYLEHRKETPIGDALAERSLSLPMWPQISSEAIDNTVDAIKTFVIRGAAI